MKRRFRFLCFVMCLFALMGLAAPSTAYTFPSGDWWAIQAQDHDAWAVEDMPSEGKLWWRAQFFWRENNWPQDHYEIIPPYTMILIDEWYMHEFRRFQYQMVGDSYDYDVMDADGTYYTTLPPPHDLEIEERAEPNWLYDWLDNDEEVEIVCKEPCDIVTYQLYVARVTFTRKQAYDDYTIVFESEHGNHVSSPPSAYKEIERIHYVVPEGQGLTNIGTRTQGMSAMSSPSVEEGQFESPVLDVVANGGTPPCSTTVLLGDYSSKLFVTEYAHLQSMAQLNAFVEWKRSELKSFKADTLYLDAIMSFNKILTLEEILTLADENDLKIKWLRYLSTEGGGKVSFEEGESIAERIAQLNEFFRQDMGASFELVAGIGALRALVPVSRLPDILRNPHVLIVDPGPVSISATLRESYPNTLIVVKWYDVFQEYLKLQS